MVKTPTFGTSPDNTSGLGVESAYPCQRGFTLIELLVVLAIAGLLVALVPSSLDKFRDASQYRDSVRTVVTGLRQARQQAVYYGKPVVVSLDLTQHEFGITGRPFVRLSSLLEIKATVGTSGLLKEAGRAEITFLPDGGATGGTIELVRRSGAGVRIHIDWLFGQVTQEARGS